MFITSIIFIREKVQTCNALCISYTFLVHNALDAFRMALLNCCWRQEQPL